MEEREEGVSRKGVVVVVGGGGGGGGVVVGHLSSKAALQRAMASGEASSSLSTACFLPSSNESICRQTP